ncbi:MAG TPA: multidrug MFS transporter, partial [Rhodobacteraceae bacterium]|nr:multidrug MFS transporter [Paracoccaceae bacterium]
MSYSLSRAEFIALIAMLHATVAFSIDSMLPALGAMAMDISPDAPNRVQLVITAFLLGMGGGTLFVGPLADAFGRKSVLIGGALLYIIASAVAATSTDLTAMIVARFVQGIGASGPRVVATAIVRDLYAGRGMVRIMSFVMMVFTLVPAVAPLAGAGLTALGSW